MNREFAHHLFQYVLVASCPLRVKEIIDFLPFDFEAGPLPQFREDPVEAVLSTYRNFLAVVDVDGSGSYSSPTLRSKNS
jgi:hypothetical protein